MEEKERANKRMLREALEQREKELNYEMESKLKRERDEKGALYVKLAQMEEKIKADAYERELERIKYQNDLDAKKVILSQQDKEKRILREERLILEMQIQKEEQEKLRSQILLERESEKRKKSVERIRQLEGEKRYSKPKNK